MGEEGAQPPTHPVRQSCHQEERAKVVWSVWQCVRKAEVQTLIWKKLELIWWRAAGAVGVVTQLVIQWTSQGRREWERAEAPG